jgi:hypothetical protein
MKDLSNRSAAPRVSQGSERAARGQHKFVSPPDTAPDIYTHLQWIGPGTFLVAAYIHKRLGY